jgi:transcription antitermination factor NusG
MPILGREPDIYPENLFDQVERGSNDEHWWALYTLSRREKELMRRLYGLSIGFYGPVFAKRGKTPSGRRYVAHEPLFSNYVFLYGNEEDRVAALTTNCISRVIPVANKAELTRDLRQFQQLLSMDVALTPEAKLVTGQRVRIRAGCFRGFEGTIIRREHEVRLLVSVDFIQRGASILVDDVEVEPV